jgi:SAM-dependent methyltransferase
MIESDRQTPIDTATMTGPTPKPFSYASDELDALAGANNYYAAIMDRFSPYFGNSIVEVGAGVGTFARHVLQQAPGAILTLVEPAVNNYRLLSERFSDDSRVSTTHGYLADVAEGLSADSLVAVNVLEHVPDDLDFLKSSCRSIRPGGHLLLYVPAMPVLFGTLDEAFEHHRRYTRRSLQRVITDAGFTLLEMRYTNLPGVVSWFAAGRIFQRRTISRAQVDLYDRWVMPGVRLAERFFSPPFGQSLLAIARKDP